MKNDLELANLPSKLAIHLEIVSVNLFSRTPFPQLFFPRVFLPTCHFTPFYGCFCSLGNALICSKLRIASQNMQFTEGIPVICAWIIAERQKWLGDRLRGKSKEIESNRKSWKMWEEGHEKESMNDGISGQRKGIEGGSPAETQWETGTETEWFRPTRAFRIWWLIDSFVVQLQNIMGLAL